MNRTAKIVLGLLIPVVAVAGEIGLSNLGVKELETNSGLGMTMFSIKIDVANTTTNPNISLQLQGVDKDGFEIDTVYLSGTVDPGATSTLSTKNVLRTDQYQSIVSWKVKHR